MRELLEEDPSQSEVNFLLGRALLIRGEPGLAVWPLRKAAQDPEYAVKAGLLLTRATLSSRFKNEAIRAATDVLDIEPENIYALEMRVEAYIGTAEHEKALADIEKAIELEPGNTNVLAYRVLALLALERLEEAQAELAVAREKVDAAEDEVPQSVRAKLCIVSGLFAFERGEKEQAELEYAECLVKYPDEPIVVLESVGFHDKLGDPERATQILRDTLDRTSSSEFRRALAQRMLSMGKAAEAERLLREEAELTGTPAAWFALADYHVQREEFEPAIGAFEQAIEASPNPSPIVRFAYADTLLAAGKPKEARRAAASIDDATLGYLIEGRARLAEGDPKGALDTFEKGIKLWPNNAGARFLAGQAAEQIGDFERAESEYRESIRAGEKQTEAGLYLARLLEAQSSHTSALDRAGSYVRSHPRDPEGYVLSIRIANRLGRRELVKEGLQRLARLPDHMGVAVALGAEFLDMRTGAEDVVAMITKAPLDLTDPVNADALALLTQKLVELERNAEAQKYASAAVAAHPDSSTLHVVQARTLQAGNQPSIEMRALYAKAIELAPENAEALSGLAELEAAAGNEPAALELYRLADATEPDTPAAGMAAFELSRSHATYTELDERLVRLLRRYPHSASVASELAVLVAAKGEDLGRALGLAGRARRFESRPFEHCRRAFLAVEASGAQPEAKLARAAIDQLPADVKIKQPEQK
ncbi:MAG: tetratricopeptide repeat protein [Deltaproteobacteria bacterium]|nr:tetratricopeptide repeat protein [Deltaproteobacteria bacterium]